MVVVLVGVHWVLWVAVGGVIGVGRSSLLWVIIGEVVVVGCASLVWALMHFSGRYMVVVGRYFVGGCREIHTFQNHVCFVLYVVGIDDLVVEKKIS